MNTLMNKGLISIAISVLLLSACAETVRVVSLNKTSETRDALIYNLPKTVLKVEAEVERSVTFKGPFAEYTDLYFQSNRSVKRNETYYRLKNITITAKAVPDSQHYYALILPEESVDGHYLSLNKILAPVGINTNKEKNAAPYRQSIDLPDPQERGPDYADLSIKSVRETVYDTIYEDVFRDSVFVKVPKVYKRKQFKSPEKQAKEMAEQIFRLRDDRLALLKGVTDANNFPDGEAVKLMIKELDKYEKQYMNMFTGQIVKSTEKHKFTITPDNSDDTSVNMFRFSEKFGILPAQVEQGEPVKLKIQKSGNLKSIDSYKTYKKNANTINKDVTFGFVYRIPDEAEVSIFLKDEELFRDRITIAQLGTISKLPIELIARPDIEIRFYPQWGSLKNISLKQ